MPPGGQGEEPGLPENAGGFYTSAEDMLAGVEQRFGGEIADRVRLSMAAGEQPRPVVADDMAVLLEAAAPVLRDLQASGGTVPEFVAEAHEDRGPDGICAWIREPGGGPGGEGVYVWLPSPAADRILSLAEQLQSWKLDELDPTGQCRRPWPECPLHPGRHSLEPNEVPGVPIWCCPDTAQVIAVIGSLDSPLPEGIPRFVQAE